MIKEVKVYFGEKYSDKFKLVNGCAGYQTANIYIVENKEVAIVEQEFYGCEVIDYNGKHHTFIRTYAGQPIKIRLELIEKECGSFIKVMIHNKHGEEHIIKVA